MLILWVDGVVYCFRNHIFDMENMETLQNEFVV